MLSLEESFKTFCATLAFGNPCHNNRAYNIKNNCNNNYKTYNNNNNKSDNIHMDPTVGSEENVAAKHSKQRFVVVSRLLLLLLLLLVGFFSELHFYCLPLCCYHCVYVELLLLYK